MRLAFLILPAAFMLLCGCAPVESEKPLSSPQTALRDPRLEGLWRSDEKDSSGYLYVAYRGHGGIGSLMSFGKDDTDGIGSYRADFFATHTAKRDYVNLNHQVAHMNGDEQTDRSGHYSFAEYHFTLRGQLVYSTVTGEAFAKAVEAGKLKGNVTYDKNKNVTGTLLKDSAEHILAFIESSKPSDIFGPATRLTRISGR